MRNIKMIIQYDGSKYNGWQKQGNTDKTIQGKIENVLKQMLGHNVEIDASGRTDAGVHALCQVANFHTKNTMHVRAMQDYLYQYLPRDIVVKDIVEVDERFHSRYNVKSKKYMYQILNDKYHDPFWDKMLLHIPQKLNIEAMKEAASYLVGSHDFTSFSTLKSRKKSMVREIYSIDFNQKGGNFIEVIFHANGFLYNMVRIIMGTLIEVGLGRIKAKDIREILEKKDRSLAGPTAPAKALILLDVEY
jgi:tRNA pseudouridine38-40 synthase